MLERVQTAVVNGRVQITLRGNGPLQPHALQSTDGLPPGVSLDLQGVDFTVPRVVRVGAGDVRAVRVALNHVWPPVTRVVVELVRATSCELSRSSAGDVVITVGEAISAGTPGDGKPAPAPLPVDPGPARSGSVAARISAPPAAAARPAAAAARVALPSSAVPPAILLLRSVPAPGATPSIVPGQAHPDQLRVGPPRHRCQHRQHCC
jgi:hypothetical protein